MSIPELATLVAVVLLSGWLAMGASPRTRIVVWLTAVAVSAAMFLPRRVLIRAVGPDAVEAMRDAVDILPWDASATAHFAAFVWLSAILWGARPDWRGWRSLAILAVLAVAAEGMQAIGGARRSASIDDALVNLLGVFAGVALAAAVTSVRRWIVARRDAD